MTVATLATLYISGLSEDGCGTAILSGVECRVPNAAPGDTVSVQLLHRSPHKPVAWAEIVAVDERGEIYREPVCRNALQAEGDCGGCPLMHLPEEEQRELKRDVINHVLEPLGVAVDEVIPSPVELDYRNRANYIAVTSRDGRVALGSYRPRSHYIALMPNCRTVRPAITRLAGELEVVFTRMAVPTFPHQNGLRYVTIRADVNGACLLELIVNGESPAWLDPLVEVLKTSSAIRGISWSVNTTTGNTIRINHSTQVWGDTTVGEVLGPITLETTASNFLQLNTPVAEAMYAQAADWIAEPTQLWDLYCGVGGLGLTCLHRAPEATLHAAEVSGEAIERAIASAGAMADRCHFITCDLATEFPQDWPTPTAVLVNPPRRGVDSNVLTQIIRASAQVIYMSCNPRSFAQNAQALLEAGYRMVNLKAWDMLPQTSHVELLANFMPA